MIRSILYPLATCLTLSLLVNPVAGFAPGDGATRTSLETDASEVLEITVTPDSNTMAFATTEITVKAGQEVRLVFDNTATSPAMKHNVVIVASNDEITRVGQAAMSEQDYVPDDDAIIAYTPLADPGETVEVTFTAPATPGDRPFICTFPGHYMSMQGTMRVTE